MLLGHRLVDEDHCATVANVLVVERTSVDHGDTQRFEIPCADGCRNSPRSIDFVLGPPFDLDAARRLSIQDRCE